MQKQANRLNQIGRDIKKLANTNDTTSAEFLKNQIMNTRNNLIKAINSNNEWEKNILTACQANDIYKEKHYIHITRAEQSYDARIENASNDFLTLQNNKLKEELNCKTRVHRTMRNILNNNNATPLTAVKRTETGPNG